MKDRFKKFLKDEDGATIVEYVIMLAIVAGIVMFAFPSLRKSIVTWITGAFDKTSDGIEGAENLYICPNGTEVADLASCP